MASGSGSSGGGKDGNAPLSRFQQRAAMESEVFAREVDEAVRKDQLQNAIRRFGIPVAALLAVALLALAGWLFWQSRVDAAAGEQGERLVSALDKVEGGNSAAALPAMTALGRDGDGAYAAVARLTAAGEEAQKGRADAAAKAFAAIAADAELPQVYRDLALLRQTMAEFDTIKPETVVARLKPLAVPGNPWFGSAGELVGIAYMRMGKNDQAGPLLGAVAEDAEVPDTIRRRARQMAGLLGVDAVDDAEAVATGGPATAGAVMPGAQPQPAPIGVPSNN